MIVARVIDPRSKLATARGLHEETLSSTLGEVLGVQDADEDALYAAMDWLLPRQADIERKLAERHLSDGTLVLYDVSSTYFEGRCCPLAKLGHSRDGKKGKLQVVFGLMCNAQGCPIAVEVFEGNTGDPKTLASQIEKLCDRFDLEHIVLVGDRGMLTSARIRKELKLVEGLEWITALRAPAIRRLVEKGALQLSLFDKKDLAEISSPDFANERLIACKNPLLAEERARKRAELLAATERELEAIVAATRRSKRPFRGKDKIALRVGRVIGRFKMAKHFRINITETGLRYERDQERIAAEALLDGIYIVRTSLPETQLSSTAVVGAYKGLSVVERAFRSLKTVDLKVRPIHHWLADRVRAHILLCMLAYYVEWHMRQALAPVLFDDDDKQGAALRRESIVAPAKRSLRAESKDATKRRPDDDSPVHSFQTLLQDLATIAKNRVKPKIPSAPEFDLVTTPTVLQRRAFDLLGVRLAV
jgi:transposase